METSSKRLLRLPQGRRQADKVIGDNILERRRETGMSQAQVAFFMQLSGHPTWTSKVQSEVETGKRSVKLHEAACLAVALDVTFADLTHAVGMTTEPAVASVHA